MDVHASPQHHTYLVLDNIRSVYNVGAIFRTADAVGVAKIYLCGTTPVPIDRFGRVRSDFAKTALGAEKSVEWEYCESATVCVEQLKQAGIEIIAVEQDSRAIPYTSLDESSNPQNTVQLTEQYSEGSSRGGAKRDRAFVFGDEVRGVSTEVLDLADTITDIPMLGEKESLNVSVAVGIILYSFLVSRCFLTAKP